MIYNLQIKSLIYIIRESKKDLESLFKILNIDNESIQSNIIKFDDEDVLKAPIILNSDTELERNFNGSLYKFSRDLYLLQLHYSEIYTSDEGIEKKIKSIRKSFDNQLEKLNKLFNPEDICGKTWLLNIGNDDAEYIEITKQIIKYFFENDNIEDLPCELDIKNNYFFYNFEYETFKKRENLIVFAYKTPKDTNDIMYSDYFLNEYEYNLLFLSSYRHMVFWLYSQILIQIMELQKYFLKLNEIYHKIINYVKNDDLNYNIANEDLNVIENLSYEFNTLLSDIKTKINEYKLNIFYYKTEIENHNIHKNGVLVIHKKDFFTQCLTQFKNQKKELKLVSSDIKYNFRTIILHLNSIRNMQLKKTKTKTKTNYTKYWKLIFFITILLTTICYFATI